MWEQGLPAMKALRSLRNRGACFASKLCSHINPLATDDLSLPWWKYFSQGLATFQAPSILPSPVMSPAFLSITKVYSGIP
ncbi:hypothetical protein SAMN04490188_2705 [Pseudomonas kilonensis]|uniref:Uncharacterized protein n=1 Tax=Pseudomonas kilonensis TaxID=132476 RepID=A0ABY0YZC2_9PSED|nr:hypothetical protein SAMN04490188_2705 [Pseudomonas kilonensis]